MTLSLEWLWRAAITILLVGISIIQIGGTMDKGVTAIGIGGVLSLTIVFAYFSVQITQTARQRWEVEA